MGSLQTLHVQQAGLQGDLGNYLVARTQVQAALAALDSSRAKAARNNWPRYRPYSWPPVIDADAQHAYGRARAGIRQS